MTTLAWHFVGERLRDGRPVPPDDEWLEYAGPVNMCSSGLHASLDPFDALVYAPGATLCLVEVDEIEQEDENKLVCRRRRIVARMDATEMLRYYSRMQALSVIHLWDAPQVMLDYLMTGEENLREAARDTVWDAVWGAAWGATWEAAWEAAREAAWGATAAATRVATRAATTAAARDAARTAARTAARADFNALVYECFEDYLTVDKEEK